MKLYCLKKILILFFSIALVLTFEQASAQTGSTLGISSAKVGQMSDQQIMQLWQQAQKSGLSENDAMSLLVKRGLPVSEVTAFKKRLVQLQGKSKSGASQSLIKDSANFMKDSSWVTEVPALKRKSNYK